MLGDTYLGHYSVDQILGHPTHALRTSWALSKIYSRHQKKMNDVRDVKYQALEIASSSFLSTCFGELHSLGTKVRPVDSKNRKIVPKLR